MATSLIRTSAALPSVLVLIGLLAGCSGKSASGSYASGKAAPALPPPATAEELADRVMAAAGADQWRHVSRIQFDFVVVRNGKEALRAAHDWDVRRNTNVVSWNGKSVSIDLSSTPTDADSKAAFARWTNDTYWLLAPLKLRDGGTRLELLEPISYGSDFVDRLRISFDGVGLTPGDVYTWYIDRSTHRPIAWDFQPNPARTVRFSWDDYVTTSGLTLSTRHFAGPTEIRIENLTVINDQAKELSKTR
jgi:hypothetical protein